MKAFIVTGVKEATPLQQQWLEEAYAALLSSRGITCELWVVV